MDEPIDLAAERNKRASPNAEFVRQDDYGRKLYTYLLSYEMDGKLWIPFEYCCEEVDAHKNFARSQV